MSLSLKPETEDLIRAQMARGGYTTADDMVRVALDVLHQIEDHEIDDREVADLRTSIEQMKRGELLDWTQISAAARAKHIVR